MRSPLWPGGVLILIPECKNCGTLPYRIHECFFFINLCVIGLELVLEEEVTLKRISAMREFEGRDKFIPVVVDSSDMAFRPSTIPLHYFEKSIRVPKYPCKYFVKGDRSDLDLQSPFFY